VEVNFIASSSFLSRAFLYALPGLSHDLMKEKKAVPEQSRQGAIPVISL